MLHISHFGTSLVLAAFLLAGCKATFVEPRPAYYANLSDAEVRTAILKGMTKRGWEQTGESGHTIHAYISKQRRNMYGVPKDGIGEEAAMDISYANNYISFKPTNPNGPVPNKSWVLNLRNDVAEALTKAQAEKK